MHAMNNIRARSVAYPAGKTIGRANTASINTIRLAAATDTSSTTEFMNTYW